MSNPSPEARRLVVVGGVAAGLSAASRARKLDPTLHITVLERGPVVSYGACGLPYWIEGQVRERDELLVLSPETLARERNILVETNACVTEILHSRRRVVLHDGRCLPYDRLVLATGSTAVAPEITGLDAPHCFFAHTWQDFGGLHTFLQQRQPATAVVVGAGFVGLEMAGALRMRGVRVTVVDAGEHPLRWGETWFTQRIQQRLAQFQIELRTRHRVQRITDEALDDLPADMVIVAAGIRPATELAAQAGIALARNGAIAVDETLETNLPGVYAAGDCASTYHRVKRAADWVPLGTTANKMGLVAGANVTGARERFPGVVGTSIVRVCGLAVATTGLSPGAARQLGFDAISARISARSRPGYFFGEMLEVELVAERESGRLLGAAVLGERDVEGRINVVATALGAATTVDEFLFTDLCYSPPYATTWDPLLVAARQLRNARPNA
ncbi:MAG: FAD-dependent oxidoreductase [Bryobacterales bacterium]|nr:FAD-dependent oxidoreductase [Bryobacterales bacterium]